MREKGDLLHLVSFFCIKILAFPYLLPAVERAWKAGQTSGRAFSILSDLHKSHKETETEFLLHKRNFHFIPKNKTKL